MSEPTQVIPAEKSHLLKRVGPYDIERKLGAGGMGMVLLGRHSESGRLAAVKILPASLARESGFVERFTREIESLRKLHNEHVVELYDDGVDDETYFYAMEYVEGESLTDRLRHEKRLHWKEVIDISIQICAALKAAHNAGIIHRDLKPSNLMISNGGTVKLTDFGIARVFGTHKLTQTGGIIGTAEYMSPEQAQGKRATKQSDLYSLGAVMYTMVTGRPPFSGKTSVEIIQKHRFGRFDRPMLIVPEMPHWLEEIICKLLEKDAEKRYPDAYVVSLRLKEVLKKVELSSQDKTEVNVAYDGSALTVAARGTAATGAVSQGPGAGTLMRDVMRAHFDSLQPRTVISRVLNNTWFQVACLSLVIAGGVYWFQGRAAPAGPDSESIEPANNEVDRIVERIRHARRLEDAAEEELLLKSLVVLLRYQPEYQQQYETAQERLKQLQARRKNESQDYALLKSSIKQAQQLVAEKHTDEARELLTALVGIYGAEPSAREYVAEIHAVLDEIDNQPGEAPSASDAPSDAAP